MAAAVHHHASAGTLRGLARPAFYGCIGSCELQVRARKKAQSELRPRERSSRRQPLPTSAGRSTSCTTGSPMAASSAPLRSATTSPECLALEIVALAGQRRRHPHFEAIAFDRGLPKTIRFDNGSEFTSHAMLRWAAEHRVSSCTSSQPGSQRRTPTLRIAQWSDLATSSSTCTALRNL